MLYQISVLTSIMMASKRSKIDLQRFAQYQ